MMVPAAARACAALRGGDRVAEGDLQLAAGLVYGHRAVRFPEAQDQDPAPPPPSEGEGDTAQSPDPERIEIPQDMVLQAVRAALPAGVLARLAAGRAARMAKGASGTGAARKGNRRGRPLPPSVSGFIETVARRE